MGVKGLNKKMYFILLLSVVVQMLVQCQYLRNSPPTPPPKPTLTLTCYQLMVFWVRGGVGAHMLILIPNVYSVATEFFHFFAIYNFSVWTVLRGLQGKNYLFVCSS